MRFLMSLFFLLIVRILYGQESLFIEGTKLLEIGDYKGADSLFTTSLSSYRNENVFFNRGVARYNLGDTIGFCTDMRIAANHFIDVEAARLYNSICCIRVDTLYYDGKYGQVDSKKYEYLEEIQYSKYDSVVLGKIYKKNFERPVVTMGLNIRKTDLIASYYLEDTIKIYNIYTENPSISNSVRWEKFKRDGAAIFRAKYSILKEQNNLDRLRINFRIIISSDGTILNIAFTDTLPHVNVDDVSTEITKDLQTFVSHYPKITPAKFLKKGVYCIAIDSIEF